MWSLLGRLGSGLLALLPILGLSYAPSAADGAVGIARISLVSGSVSMQHGASGGSMAAWVNAPVAAGDYLSTASNSRAEIQLDNFTFVRVDSGAQLRFTQLDPTTRTLQLAAGTIELRTFPNGAAAQVQTPSVTIRPSQPGRYRITVTNDGSTLLAVRSGSADVLMPQGAQSVAAGYAVKIFGSSSQPELHSVADIAYDGFDQWNSDRDQFAERAFGTNYASSAITGLADLNAYGRWMYDPAYGEVWVPDDEAVNWAPYHYGRWAWQPYWGWTWIGYEPWGWAPYHYGRWFYRHRFGWAWYPGFTPYWQPALVAFFGCGDGFGFDFPFGNVGWVPLAPFEPFYPWWPSYLSRGPRIVYNITNVNIINIYHNASAPGGVAVVNAGSFKSTQPYRFVPIREVRLGSATLAKGGLPIAPSAQSMRFADRTNFEGGLPISPRFDAMKPAIAKPIVAPAIARQTNTDVWGRFGTGSHVSAPTQARAVAPTTRITRTTTVTQHAPVANVWSRFDGVPSSPAQPATTLRTEQTTTHTYSPSNWWDGYNASNYPRSTTPTQTYGHPTVEQPVYSTRVLNDPYRTIYSAPPRGWNGQTTASSHPSGQSGQKQSGSQSANGGSPPQHPQQSP